MRSASKHEVTVVSGHVETQNLNIYTTAGNESQKKFPISFGIPNAVSSFRGREEEVENLDRLFDTSKVVALHGLGGYGKTQLACHYAVLRQKKYCGNLVWIQGETEDYLKGSFRAAALELKISEYKERKINSVIEEVYNYFEGTRVLFVIDNAQDYRSILEFLPESSKLKVAEVNVLITSQSSNWGNIPGLLLQGLSLEYALMVLSTIIGEDIFNNIPQDEWKDLAETFYCIPLGLQIGGGYVRQRLSSRLSNNFSIKRYIARIKEKNMLLDEELAMDSCSNYKKTIYRSLYVTVEKMENNDREESKWALDIINVCAHLNPDDITDKLLLNLPVIDDKVDKLEEALAVLEQHSLIIIEKKQNSFSKTMIRIHRLVQMFFRYHQGKNQTVITFYREALFTVTTCISYWDCAPCAYVLADINNLKLLLESLTRREKKAVMKQWKLLHVASKVVLLRVMQLLLQHGADVNNSYDPYYKKITPMCFLMNASIGNFDEIKRRNWEEAVRLLLKHKANITNRGLNNETVLHAAANWKCTALIDHILNNKQLHVNVKDYQNRVPLHYVTCREILDEAEMSKAKECIQLLVSRNADINVRDRLGQSVLHYTAKYCNWPLTEFLIDQFGMDSNMRDHNGNTPLLLISYVNYLNTEREVDRAKKTIEVLAKRDAFMKAQNKDGTGILHSLAERRYLPLIEYLVDIYSLNVNIQDCDECTPLHFLAKRNIYSETDMKICKELTLALVQRGANVNATNSDGVPILSMASLASNTLLITYLLEEHQANINQQDNQGRTPLFWAVQRRIYSDTDQKLNEDTTKFLISKNANPVIKDREGRTILHHCALLGNWQLLEFFIDQNCFNPNEQDVNGFTALHFIAKGEDIWDAGLDAVLCIYALRKRGVRLDLVNNENLTPAQLAERENKSFLIKLLQ